MKNIHLTLSALLIFATPLWSYDQVRIDKVISLPDKKAEPGVIHMDPTKKLWMLNKANNTLQQLSPGGIASLILKPGKKATDLFREPMDFAFFKDGSLLVADPGLSRVAILTSETPEWKKPKILNQIPLKNPLSVAVSHDDVIAVGSDGQASIDIYSADGVLLHRLFPPENKAIKSINSLAFANDGTLWALDSSEERLHRFSSSRKWLGSVDSLSSPVAVTVDEYGNAYVCLEKGQWQEVSREGKITGGFGTKGKNPGQLSQPAGIASAGGKLLWVSETGNKRLQSFRVDDANVTIPVLPGPAAFLQVRLDSVWQERAALGLFGSDGKILLLNEPRNSFEWVDPDGKTDSQWAKAGKNAAYKKPQDLTLDSTGGLWITDAAEHTIKNLSAKGELLKTVGQKGKKEGSLKDPNFLRVRSDGSFVVADRDNSRVQVLSAQGLFLFSLGSQGKKEGQFTTVTGLAVNKDKIAVLDGDRKALLFFSSNGQFQSEVSNKEGKVAFWEEPTAVASDSIGRFYVLDNGSRRVRVFDAAGQFMADFTADGHTLACGGDHKVLTISKQEVRVYTVNFVARELKNVQAVDEAGVIKVTWERSPEASSYNIYRSSSPDSQMFLTKTPDAVYGDDKVVPNVSYTYAVSGVNDKDFEGIRTLSNSVKPSRRRDISLVSIEKITFDPVFTAAFKYYAGKPIGEIDVQNNDDIPHRNIKISLTLKKYGDYATETVVENLGPGERRTVRVTMTFNDSVLELTEDTPVQMDVRVSYFEDNEEKSVTQNAPITLYSRNAISWSDKARVASFVTPRDTPIVEFARAAIRSFLPHLKTSSVGKPMAKMILFYESLNALGMSYVPDPKTPFIEVSGHPEMIDYVQFPRETLRRKTGDCDDTTSLLASLLESIGVQTALVDTPGHIFLMANLEESDASEVGFPEERLVEHNGTLWLPIETTQLGKNFASAWQTAAAEVKSGLAKGKIEFIPVSEAHEKYAPVTLVEVDKDTPPYPEEKVKAAFLSQLEQFQKERYDNRLKAVQALIKADPDNAMLKVQLGMVHVEGGKAADGEAVFKSLLKEGVDADVQSAAANNLGNVAYLNGKYQDALDFYDKAGAMAPDDGGILINRARAQWRLGKNDEAKDILSEARSKMKDWREYTGDIPVELHPK